MWQEVTGLETHPEQDCRPVLRWPFPTSSSVESKRRRESRPRAERLVVSRQWAVAAPLRLTTRYWPLTLQLLGRPGPVT